MNKVVDAGQLVEVICATHLSSYVDLPGFTDRGGLMLVGAPGMLKTTFIGILDRHYPDALMLSDINAQGLVRLRDIIATGGVRTLVIPELRKLYERNEATASNVEGTLRALVSEGFQAASFEDQRVNRARARATVIGALTPATQSKRFTDWEESGLNRRFLWSLIRLEDATILDRAAVACQSLDFQLQHVPRAPLSGESIPNLTTAPEREQFRLWVKYQPGGMHALQLQLLTRQLAVLRYWYQEAGINRDPMETMRAFAQTLGREGAEIRLPSVARKSVKTDVRRIEGHMAHVAGKQLAERRWKKPPKKKPKSKK